ncbi:MarR family transcriptional regulator [Halobacteriales archaeon QS_8_69_26]|nr:MAG: MarR family transcriptional regulator [Halobacteriales archaeon QS_8_69_26]
MPEDNGVDEDKRATLRRFAALGAASPIASLTGGAEAQEGDSEARGAIAGYLAATPGAHFSKVRDDLQLGTGETQYHLRKLDEEGAVESRKDGDYKRFYPAGEFSEFDQVALGYLRRETPRGMLVGLLRDPDVTAGDLADRLGVSRPTVSSYAGELEAAGLLSREDGYAVRNPETVLTLVVRYADSFDADAADLANQADGLIRFDP